MSLAVKGEIGEIEDKEEIEEIEEKEEIEEVEEGTDVEEGEEAGAIVEVLVAMTRIEESPNMWTNKRGRNQITKKS